MTVDSRLSGTSALVTGGVGGLGRATAQRLAAEGATVVIVDLASSAGARLARELGGEFAAADVADSEAIGDAVSLASSLAPLRTVVNCAGITTPASVLDRDGRPVSLRVFENVIRVNLIGTFNVVGHAASAMLATDEDAGGGRGLIVNTSSVAAFDGPFGQSAYAASKAGVHAITLPIAREFARHGVRICTIAPGIMETPMLDSLPAEARQRVGAQVPYPSRPGHPGEFAEMVMALVRIEYLNGVTIRLDGGVRIT